TFALDSKENLDDSLKYCSGSLNGNIYSKITITASIKKQKLQVSKEIPTEYHPPFPNTASKSISQYCPMTEGIFSNIKTVILHGTSPAGNKDMKNTIWGLNFFFTSLQDYSELLHIWAGREHQESFKKYMKSYKTFCMTSLT
uniref:Uncharacterized protein n=1 Tax=Coturnix japonica TaxID=93934 RepID=A0A8C2TZ64_COTJA